MGTVSPFRVRRESLLATQIVMLMVRLAAFVYRVGAMT